MIGTTGMDHESHPAHDSSPYGTHPGWADVHAYSQSATVSEMGGFGYIPTGLPSDSLSRLAPSPTTVQSQQSQPQSTSPPTSHHQAHHQQLPMLIMPSHTWPSMLTNPVVSYPPAAMAAPAIAPPPPLPTKPSRTTTSSTPRRTLTDDDRRRMCRYHEENPTKKQIDIGVLFGVERR
ncbi:hypothetical protein IMZ48_14995 [Candidatus Bathyarchaeota archaeon]|nr:hypothetical protein [Candidatus Bathyarchaeota archaeon]